MKKFIKGFGYAMKGIAFSLEDQVNMKVHMAVGVLVICAGFFYSITISDWCIVLICIAVVIGFEMMNTALENLVDLVSLERTPLAGKIKDIAAGGVLIVSLGSAVIGILVFSKYIA
jgi:diacylglycerol kinase